MECKNCKYHNVGSFTFGGREYTNYSCKITHVYGPKFCPLVCDDDVESMDICYNCKHWMGGGDWGLSCKKNYYNCSTNGFDKACEQFERNGNDS